MADYRTALEAQAWARVDAAMVASGLLEGLKRDHLPMLAKQLSRSLRALGFAVYRGNLLADAVDRVISASIDQASRGQITALESLISAMSTPLHFRTPNLRAGIPFLIEARLPDGAGYFTDSTRYWAELRCFIDQLAPCLCMDQTKDKPRAHQHAA